MRLAVRGRRRRRRDVGVRLHEPVEEIGEAVFALPRGALQRPQQRLRLGLPPRGGGAVLRQVPHGLLGAADREHLGHRRLAPG